MTVVTDTGFTRPEQELRVSPRLVSAMLIVIGLAMGFAGDTPRGDTRSLLAALSLLILAVVIWWLADIELDLARWVACVSLAGVVVASYLWLGDASLLTLLVIPAILAIAMLGTLWAIAVAVCESLVLAWLLIMPSSSLHARQMAIALLTIWGSLGATLALVRLAHGLASWSWEHYQRAQVILDEARERQADLKQALDDLAHANKQLALANEHLATARLIAEEAQKARAQFVSKVSHEFRTPLNMIIGLTDLLMETPEIYGQDLPPALLKDLEIVHRSCEHLSGMINDVLDLSQIEAERFALRREQVDLMEVVEQAISVVRPLIDKKGLWLTLDASAPTLGAYCDRTRIRQVILNLVSNAARFTEIGGITIRVEHKPDVVRLCVVDTGPGVPEEDAERIFEPFYQGSSLERRNASGSGLGLSISRQFVELHGGRMWLESSLGSGSAFSFELPTRPALLPLARPERWISEAWPWVERRARLGMSLASLNPRVILHDQTGELLPIISGYAEDVEFVPSDTLLHARRLLEEGGAQALILNACFPGQLTALLNQARAVLPDLPVLGFSLPPSAEHALAAGASAYLVRPMTRMQLAHAIADLGRPVHRVLIIDDEADAQRLLTRMLRASDPDIEVIVASDGEAGLAAMREERPDLVLLDIVMPDMDGWEVLSRRAEDAVANKIPIIVISAQDPRSQPSTSPYIMAAMGEGLSLGKVLLCIRALWELLRWPGDAHSLEQLETPDGELVSSDSTRPQASTQVPSP